MGKSTISMAIFNSYVSLPEGIISLGNRHPFTILPRARPRAPGSCKSAARHGSSARWRPSDAGQSLRPYMAFTDKNGGMIYII